MNQKKAWQQFCLLSVGLLFGVSSLFAQSGYREKENIEYLSQEEIQTKLEELKRLRTTLPTRVDHSKSSYISPVIHQGSMGSCGSASRICYMFAYEINNYRNLDGKKAENRYPSHFTWLLTDQNSDKENIARFNGIPTALTYGTSTTGTSSYQYNPTYGGYVSWPKDYPNYGWMNGYDKWRSAMDNRIEKTEDIKLNTDEAIEYLKWWIYNHHGDNSFNEGGVAGGGAATGEWETSTIPAGKYKAGEHIVTSYGPAIDHGVTWVGYDDKIEFDLNGNGKIDADEQGALIMLNSWGGDWGNKGCIYVPYKIVKTYGGGLGAELYYIRKDYKPLDVFRIKMDYNERCNIRISIGISSDPNAIKPDKKVVAEHFNYAGFEPIPLLGEYKKTINEEAMEFGLDLTDLMSFGFDTRNKFRYFLIVETKSGSTGTGSVQELEVIRHPQGLETVAIAPQVVGKIEEPVAISGSKKTFYIPVDVPGTDAVEPEHLYVPQNRLKVKLVSTEEKNGEVASGGGGLGKHSIDGDESTYWHSAYSAALSHFIIFEVDSLFTLTGFEYLPRQNSSNGRIGDYKFYALNSIRETGTLIAEGTFENNKNVKQVFFDPVKTKLVKLINTRSAGGDSNTCMAEFNLFYSAKEEDPTSTNSVEIESLDIQQNGSYFRISGIDGDVTFSLYNMQGQKLVEKSAYAIADRPTELNASSLDKGVYILQITYAGQTVTKKILLF